MEIKNILNRRKKGNIVGEAATTLMAIIVFSVILWLGINQSKESVRVTELQKLGRQYIINMETNGFLDDSNRNQLISSLENLGAKNISLAGTTTNKTTYGNQINLMISADMEVESLNLKGLNVSKEKQIVRFDRSWSSTAKN